MAAGSGFGAAGQGRELRRGDGEGRAAKAPAAAELQALCELVEAEPGCRGGEVLLPAAGSRRAVPKRGFGLRLTFIFRAG